MFSSEEKNGNGNGRWDIGKFLRVYVIPILVIVVGYLIQDKLTTITSVQNSSIKELKKITDAVAEVKTSIAVINSSFQSHNVEDINFENSTKFILQDHETRLRSQEALVPTIHLPNK
jgi:hypothetical protein